MIMQKPINELISGKKCDESVSDDEGTMSRRDDQGGWQWREEVKLIVRNSLLSSSQPMCRTYG